MINKVTLVGHVGQDPEIRRLENGTPVGRFSLATKESYKDTSGEWQSQTEWHNITVWRAVAEQAERQVKKGSFVYIEGKLTHRKYTDKNGIERDATDIVANMIRTLDKPAGSGAGIRESSFPTQEPAMTSNRSTQNGGGSEPIFEVVAPTEEPPAVSDDLPF
jgi:single-strand DNA-binding protein